VIFGVYIDKNTIELISQLIVNYCENVCV